MNTAPRDDDRLAGTLITVDGPGGVGKSTTISRVMETLRDAGLSVHATRQPSEDALGELARHGTDTYRGMALACLCAADRHHQLDREILPALHAGRVVVSDRYLPSSLVLQGLDDLDMDVVWQLNTGVYRPDLSVIITGDPGVINSRLRARGGHSRFERAADNSVRETQFYTLAAADLDRRGWPVAVIDTTSEATDQVAARIVALVHHTLLDTKDPVCPSA